MELGALVDEGGGTGAAATAASVRDRRCRCCCLVPCELELMARKLQIDESLAKLGKEPLDIGGADALLGVALEVALEILKHR